MTTLEQPEQTMLEPAYIHVRNTDRRHFVRGSENANYEQPTAKGGMTIAYWLKVENVGGTDYVVVHAGVGRCWHADAYIKKLGRMNAVQQLKTNPLKFILTKDLEVTQSIEGHPGFVSIRERDFPVIENVIDKVDSYVKMDRESKVVLKRTAKALGDNTVAKDSL